MKYVIYIMDCFLKIIFVNPVTGISAGVLALGLLTRLVALFKPCKYVIWSVAGGVTCISFVILLFLLLFVNGMSAGPTPSVHLVEILFLIGGSVLLGGIILLCYYYWRFVWPVCIVGFLVGLFCCGGIRAIKEALF